MKKYICLALVAFVGTAMFSTVVAPSHTGTNAASTQHQKKDHAKGDATAHTPVVSEGHEGDAAPKKK